ncbi:MAG: hypothetical protein WCB94_18995 [Terriglobales bacterium]
MLLAGHTIDRLDPEAAEELLALVERLGERQVQVAASGLRDEVSDMLQRAAGAGRAKAWFFPTQARALEALYEEAHRETREETCPLRAVVAAP